LAGAGPQLRLGRPTAALPLIEQVIVAAPALAPALDLHARILSDMGRFRAAKLVVARAAEAARSLPELPRLQIERNYWLSLQNHDELRRVTEKLRALAPDDPLVVLTGLGRTAAERLEKLQAPPTARGPATLAPPVAEAQAAA